MPDIKNVVSPHDLSDVYFDKGNNTALKIEYKFSYSIATLRTAVNIPNVVFITDSGKQGMFQYDSTDTTSTDNGTTVIVNGTKRFKKVSSSSDSFLLERANHTGVQSISTVTGLQTSLDTKQANLTGTGFVKSNNGTISYDNTSYLPLTGGSLTGSLSSTGNVTITGSPSNTIQGGNFIYLNGGTGTSFSTIQQGIGKFDIWGFNGNTWVNNLSINNSNGNVGIGTNLPTERLEVNGGVKFKNGINPYLSFDNGTNVSYIQVASSIFDFNTPNPITFNIGGSARMMINNSGNVGIGTTNPFSKIHLFGYGQTNGFNLGDRGDNPNTVASSIFLSDTDNGVLNVNVSKSNVGFGRIALNPHGGNVSIGANTTNSTLDVNGNITSSTGINVTGNGGFFNSANKFGLDVYGGATRFYSSGGDASTRGGYEFHTVSSNGLIDNTTLFVGNNIRVGVNNTAPNYTLDVSGDINTTGAYFLNGNSLAYSSNGSNTINGRLVNNSSGVDGMYIGYGNNSNGITRVFDGGTSNNLSLSSGQFATTGFTKHLFGTQTDDGTENQFAGAVKMKSDLTVNGANGTFSTQNVQSNLYYLNLTRSSVSLITSGSVGIGTTAPTSKLQVVDLPVYADNTSAIAGGLTVGAFYRTSTGVLMVVF